VLVSPDQHRYAMNHALVTTTKVPTPKVETLCTLYGVVVSRNQHRHTMNQTLVTMTQVLATKFKTRCTLYDVLVSQHARSVLLVETGVLGVPASIAGFRCVRPGSRTRAALKGDLAHTVLTARAGLVPAARQG
jgi:hypothetical protein